MAPSPPTGREVLILITLLISLVFLSNSNAPSSPFFSHAVLNTSHVVSWQPTTVPETTVVTHAPGRLFLVTHFDYTYTIQDGPFSINYTFSKALFT
jgi:hypothetical protein